MSTFRCCRPLVLALGLLLASGAAAESHAQSIGPYFLGVPYGTTMVGDPLFDETKFDLFYPVGGCPTLWGCSSRVMPVAVLVHGGNTNSPLSSPAQLSDLSLQLLAQGFVVVLPSYHVLNLTAGEDYVNATDDIARLIQYLRHYHTMMNIDPARVFCQGHSAGGFHTLYVGLNADFRNPASADPVAQESSRPDFLIPWGAPSDWTCLDFANADNSYMSLLVFGVMDASNVPLQEKLAQSPTWWLAHPELYERTTTPPMCLVYNLSAVSPCGAVVNAHDGEFGVVLHKALGRLCVTSAAGQPCCSQSVLVTSADTNAAIQAVVAWMTERAF